jgi:hypothetical protein
MSETLDTNASAPQGKGMAVTGLVLSIVSIPLAYILTGVAVMSVVAGGSAWASYVGIVVSVLSVIMSAMGMSKLGKTGGKKGIAVAGLVIGIVAVILSIIWMMTVSAAAAMLGGAQDQLQDLMNSIPQN